MQKRTISAVDTPVSSESDDLPVFRFSITWRYVSPPDVGSSSRPPVAVKTQERPASTSVEVVARKPVPIPAKTSLPVKPSVKPEWEMVIPKMARPQVKEPPSSSREKTTPATKSSDFDFKMGELDKPRVPKVWRIAAIIAAVLVIGIFAIWVRPARQDTVVAVRSNEEAASGWTRKIAFPAGRQLLLFDPTMRESNYRMDFSWFPDAQGVGVVFRARDPINYYSVQIRLVQGGSTPAVSVERSGVFAGTEGARVRKVVALSKNDYPVRVRLDATGPAFSISVQGNPVDYWTDQRLTSGGVGFYEERGHQPNVGSVRFTIAKSGGFQTLTSSFK